MGTQQGDSLWDAVVERLNEAGDRYASLAAPVDVAAEQARPFQGKDTDYDKLAAAILALSTTIRGDHRLSAKQKAGMDPLSTDNLAAARIDQDGSFTAMDWAVMKASIEQTMGPDWSGHFSRLRPHLYVYNQASVSRVLHDRGDRHWSEEVQGPRTTGKFSLVDGLAARPYAADDSAREGYSDQAAAAYGVFIRADRSLLEMTATAVHEMAHDAQGPEAHLEGTVRHCQTFRREVEAHLVERRYLLEARSHELGRQATASDFSAHPIAGKTRALLQAQPSSTGIWDYFEKMGIDYFGGVAGQARQSLGSTLTACPLDDPLPRLTKSIAQIEQPLAAPYLIAMQAAPQAQQAQQAPPPPRQATNTPPRRGLP